MGLDTPSKMVSSDGSPLGLSGQDLVARSGDYLDRIAHQLRALERIYLASCSAPMPAEIQQLDLVIQQIAGLSHVLSEASSHLSHEADWRLHAAVLRPRLQSLTEALLGMQATPRDTQIELF